MGVYLGACLPVATAMPATAATTAVPAAAVAATAVRTATAARRAGATTATTLAHATTLAGTHVLRRGLDAVTHRASVAAALRPLTLCTRGTGAVRALAHRDALRHRGPTRRHPALGSTNHQLPRARPCHWASRLHVTEHRRPARVTRQPATKPSPADPAPRGRQVGVGEHRCAMVRREHRAAPTEPDRRAAHERMPREERVPTDEREPPWEEPATKSTKPEAEAKPKPEWRVAPRRVEPRVVREAVARTADPRIAVRAVAVVAIERRRIAVVGISRRTLAVLVGATRAIARRGHGIVDEIVVEPAAGRRHRLHDIRQHALRTLPTRAVRERTGVPGGPAARELIELEWILRDGGIHHPLATRRGHHEAPVR